MRKRISLVVTGRSRNLRFVGDWRERDQSIFLRNRAASQWHPQLALVLGELALEFLRRIPLSSAGLRDSA